ncbi:glycine-rich domain-containing protein [Streptosporangium canum]|uniref:glycine-rich domain-containing protein n=1 Tax=Streptosporangium canum TaxID=324952 RepID=UPI0037B2633C
MVPDHLEQPSGAGPQDAVIIVVDRAAGRADDVGLSCAAWPLAAVSSSDRGSARGSGLAEQIMKQALSFLAACAARPYARLAPSELVDIGWHTFILYTREYAEFCEQVAGRFINHAPDDDPSILAPAGSNAAATVFAVRAALPA